MKSLDEIKIRTYLDNKLHSKLLTDYGFKSFKFDVIVGPPWTVSLK